MSIELIPQTVIEKHDFMKSIRENIALLSGIKDMKLEPAVLHTYEGKVVSMWACFVGDFIKMADAHAKCVAERQIELVDPASNLMALKNLANSATTFLQQVVDGIVGSGKHKEYTLLAETMQLLVPMLDITRELQDHLADASVKQFSHISANIFGKARQMVSLQGAEQSVVEFSVAINSLFGTTYAPSDSLSHVQRCHQMASELASKSMKELVQIAVEKFEEKLFCNATAFVTSAQGLEKSPKVVFKES